MDAQIIQDRYGLSNRELEVVETVAKGITNKEAGNALFVTEKTIKFHLTNIYKKIGVKSRAELIVKFLHSFPEKPAEPIKCLEETQKQPPFELPQGQPIG